MQILLVCATEMEMGNLRIRYPNLDVLLTGVGAPQTCFQLTRRLHQMDYDWVIQLGIAGVFEQTESIGSAFLVNRDCFADLLLIDEVSALTIYEAGLAEADEFPFNSGWLNNPHLSLLPDLFPQASSITVNTVTGEASVNKRHAQKFGATLESMEGAALHYVCRQLDVPFLQIRGVSNRVGDRNKANWKIAEALQASYALLDRVLALPLPVLQHS
jgi:futalosine hydrolase